MSKDPAFLFYPGDWLSGTMGMSFEQKGAYLELLIFQFNRGHMGGRMIGQLVGQIWDTIKDKFIQDDKGLWFNVRLDEEKFKRKKYTESRRNNILGINQYSKNEPKNEEKESGHMEGHMEGHMTSHMENENKDENICINKEKNLKKFPDEKILNLDLPKIKIEAAIELLKISKQIDATEEKILCFWTVFKKQNFTGKKFYADVGDIYSHFINWIGKQNISDGHDSKHHQRGRQLNGKPLTGADKLAASLNSNLEKFGEG